jgi:hypothetical protein
MVAPVVYVFFLMEFVHVRAAEIRILLLSLRNIQSGLAFIRDWAQDPRATCVGLILGAFHF